MREVVAREHANRVLETLRRHESGDFRSNFIMRSWQRCVKDYSLNPAESCRGSETTRSDLDNRLNHNTLLLSNARAEMSSLVQQFLNRDTVVVIADPNGIVLHAMGEGDFAVQAARVGMRPGGDWSERASGTNGIGTCLAERALVNVERNDHFFPNLVRLSCCGAPIFDDNGDLAGVLNVTSGLELSQQHFPSLVGMSAQTIENRLLEAKHHERIILRLHSRRELVHTFHEGLIAVDADGTVRAINQSAMFMLGIANRRAIIGLPLTEIFVPASSELLTRTRANGGKCVPVQVVGGRVFFVQANEPGAADSHTEPVRAAREPLWTGVATPVAAPVSRWAAADQDVPCREFGDDTMERDFSRAVRVYDRAVNVLLEGETGSGKERFARALHDSGARSRGPFVAVNCAAVPENLIESELFGYRSGAFSGASREGRRGRILAADKGTLLLDEIGDMPLQLQARLLRVLEEREVTPLGGDSPIKVDIRLICATHRNLRDMVAQGSFRSDLYFRIACYTVVLPPLRARAGRRRLIRAVLAETAQGMLIDEEALDLLEAYSWPGNLRQLRNVLQTAAALCDSNVIRASDLGAEVHEGKALSVPTQPFAHAGASFDPDSLGGPISAPALPSAELPVVAGGSSGPVEDDGLSFLDRAERDALLNLLRQHRWNITNVAAELGVSRNTVYRKTNRFGLMRE